MRSYSHNSLSAYARASSDSWDTVLTTEDELLRLLTPPRVRLSTLGYSCTELFRLFNNCENYILGVTNYLINFTIEKKKYRLPWLSWLVLKLLTMPNPSYFFMETFWIFKLFDVIHTCTFIILRKGTKCPECMLSFFLYIIQVVWSQIWMQTVRGGEAF